MFWEKAMFPKGPRNKKEDNCFGGSLSLMQVKVVTLASVKQGGVGEAKPPPKR